MSGRRYEAAGREGYDDPLKRPILDDQNEEKFEGKRFSIHPKEEDAEARWDKILRDRLKVSER